ncbi:ecdysteroid-regulated 16 kDa protein [Bradysia coprophila]|uniref:ecdysteroid-regulated 16 kDa protein n=1 Tax=Bradysia coprophila TaxID=38358 RepID=UPI00187DAD46|nr:ecdysteroid-regulated 16 kDa protein [Bradysia coprophila]XP_037026346.1 ecdysteroid-regulated 16 kDa protein [Bradysia coprophila]XP_037026347.1 ecdysteroid-regulated 16 kDa protein [Bradysia coprophila]
MHLQTSFVLLLVCFVTLTLGTEVKQCKGSKTKKLDPSEVSVSNCNKGTCKLQKKTTVEVSLKFAPAKDLKTLTTSVYANVLNVPLPFIGVDGASACDKLFKEDGTTPSSCPLKAGETYVYKNSFPILEFYPKLNLVVHWALTHNDENIACFELPAKIS